MMQQFNQSINQLRVAFIAELLQG